MPFLMHALPLTDTNVVIAASTILLDTWSMCAYWIRMQGKSRWTQRKCYIPEQNGWKYIFVNLLVAGGHRWLGTEEEDKEDKLKKNLTIQSPFPVVPPPPLPIHIAKADSGATSHYLTKSALDF